ncbi:DUF4350 domain-containing protein [Lyngbya confervoides]|uniref:DUF4350 domain-containing protein n=1 Tax=Lyngbya confervoides BDU141951 TaxID=1574623 RepID=A0ABD4T758_9CYAN|nr:DUF4350 domain-containing protein [Lyngbya confervoides]MCM1984558.1 DUF4350 domain-containing protein [Lyngbya confervoides BDU141951]
MKGPLRRRWLLGLVILMVIVGGILVLAPRSDRQGSGSTFSRAPDGYGAWYAYMEQRGIPIQRWRRPLQDLIAQQPQSGHTLVQVLPFPRLSLSELETAWIQQGNTWVMLGLPQPVTPAPFSSQLSTPQGPVHIQTARRYPQTDEALLSDRFGAVLWRETLGQGSIIYGVPADLAANAYQEAPGNFPFLANLVGSGPIWIDEYLHGYKDPEVAQAEGDRDWASYLLKTPLLLLLIQGGILVMVLIWANNRRFGQPIPLTHAQLDNSEAYIQALAAILHKADRSEFVIEVVGREEQLQVQRSLGLGHRVVDREAFLRAWTEQTGRPGADLMPLLSPDRPKTARDLRTWLWHLEHIRQHLPQRSRDLRTPSDG